MDAPKAAFTTPNAELTPGQKAVFGADAKLHPVTGMPLETGRGALSDKQQALIHLGHIEREQGQEVALVMYEKIMGAEKATELRARMNIVEDDRGD